MIKHTLSKITSTATISLKHEVMPGMNPHSSWTETATKFRWSGLARSDWSASSNGYSLLPQTCHFLASSWTGSTRWTGLHRSRTLALHQLVSSSGALVPLPPPPLARQGVGQHQLMEAKRTSLVFLLHHWIKRSWVSRQLVSWWYWERVQFCCSENSTTTQK